MSFAEKHNKGQNVFTFKLPENSEFKKLSELDENATYIVRGFFISKAGKYGKHPVAVVSYDDLDTGFFVDFPKNSTEEIEEIIKDADDVNAINELHVGINTHKYDNKYGKGFTGFTFVDI